MAGGAIPIACAATRSVHLVGPARRIGRFHPGARRDRGASSSPGDAPSAAMKMSPKCCRLWEQFSCSVVVQRAMGHSHEDESLGSGTGLWPVRTGGTPVPLLPVPGLD